MYTMAFHFSQENRLPLKYFSKCCDLDQFDDEAILKLRDRLPLCYQNGTFMLNVCVLLQWFEHFFSDESWFSALKTQNNIISILKIAPNKCTVEWNQNNCLFMDMVEKRSCQSYMFPQLENEYFVGAYGINFLRLLIPNFVFTYYISRIPSQISIHQEYIPGESFLQYLGTMNDTIQTVPLMKNFITIFLQVLLSLEVAQQTLQFTHHDLHGENIMLRPCRDQTIVYPIFETTYEFRHCQCIPTLIDFEFSTIRHKNLIIAHDPLCYTWGIYPFYIPGSDILRFVLSCFLYTRHSAPNTVGRRVYSFSAFLLQEFFGMNLSLFQQYRQKLKRHNFNFTMSKAIFHNPLELIQFCDTHEANLCILLDISDFGVVRKKKNPSLYVNPTSESVQETKDAMGIEEPLLFTMEKNLFHHMRNHYDIVPLEELIELVTCDSIYVPNLHIHRRLQIDFFSKKYDWFLYGYEYYYHDVVLQGREKFRKLFLNNIIALTRFYRQALTIYLYHFFLHESLHGVPPLEEDRYYYLVKSLFK